MSKPAWTEHTFSFPGGHTRYLAAGPTYGPLLVFVHGWITVAESWKHQILAFSQLGFRVIAPDGRGYGGSIVTKNPEDYRHERLVEDLKELMKHLNRDKAIFIGHDWGAGVVNCVMGHAPEICNAVVSIACPYWSVEHGIDHLISLSNRDIYPEDEYPAAQWDYMIFHNENPERAAATLDKNPENTIKFLFAADATKAMKGYMKPAPVGSIRKNGGWFGKEDGAPDMDLKDTILRNEPEVFEAMVKTVRENGTFGPNAYYRNFPAAIEWHKQIPNGGITDVPYLYIDPKFDGICDGSLSRLAEPARQRCRNMHEVCIEAEHWVQLEKPDATNAAILKWILTAVPEQYPGFWRNPLVKNLRFG